MHTVVLSDMQGRVLRTMRGNGTTRLELQREHLSNGVYTVRLINASGATEESLRLVLE